MRISRGVARWGVLTAGPMVLLLWSSAGAFHDVTFSQTNSNIGGTAIMGTATAPFPPGHSPVGVWGESTSGTGVFGCTGGFGCSSGPALPFPGVQGESVTPFGVGVRGYANVESGVGVEGRARGTGVRGWAFPTSGSTTGVSGQSDSPSGTGVFGVAPGPGPRRLITVPTGVWGLSPSTAGRGVVGQATAASGATTGVMGQANSPDGAAFRAITSNGARAGIFNGRVDINCASPPCLFVNSSGVADLAEDMRVVGRAAAADVVVLADQTEGVTRATRPYDTRVAGVVATAPRMVFQSRPGGRTVPVALIGVVKAKATAANGAIRRGDLLTTSGHPGHLMRCERPARCVGAIVGKAMEPLPAGQRQILVLLWRQ